MKYSFFALCLALCLPVAAQEQPAAAEPVVVEAAEPAAAAQPAVADSAQPAAGQPAAGQPAAGQAAAETESPAAEAAAAPVSPAAPASAAELAALEWDFLRSNSETRDDDVAEALLSRLAAWIGANPDAAGAPEALLLKANLHLRLGDYRSAIVALLKLMQEYPSSASFDPARQLLSITADKKLGKKEKPLLLGASRAPAGSDRAASLAYCLFELTAKFGKDYYSQLLPEYESFFSRFPAYPGRDALLQSLASLHAGKGEYVQARLDYEKLIHLFPASPRIAQAKLQLAGVLAENLKDYFAAIKMYRDVADKYPGTPEAWAAYAQLPRLTEKQKQYPLAIEIYESIIKLYPDKPEARNAFKAEARILREELSKPAEAIAVLNRLADKYKDEAAAEELYLAADIARKDLKDTEAEVKIYDRIAAEYPGKEAIKALTAAAKAYEKIKETEKARKYYEQIVQNFPGDSAAKKAQQAIDALQPRS